MAGARLPRIRGIPRWIQRFRRHIKKLPEILVQRAKDFDRSLLLLFFDEARFGRISDPGRCWAPRPIRPLVSLQWVREFRYVYAAMGPQEGTLHWRIEDSMRAEALGRFLEQLSGAHPDRQVILVMDQARSHKAKDLAVPENVSLEFLPPYSPELNPVEILWHELREKYCTNRVFDSLEAVCHRVETGLSRFQSDPVSVLRLCRWPWIENGITMIAT